MKNCMNDIPSFHLFPLTLYLYPVLLFMIHSRRANNFYQILVSLTTNFDKITTKKSVYCGGFFRIKWRL